METINVLNLGAGVQSTAIACMTEQGILPKPDYIVFADTGCEPKQVYENLEWLKQTLTQKIHVVTKGNLMKDMKEGITENEKKYWPTIPFYVENEEGKRAGMATRQCTKNYKILPIEQFVRYEIAGLKPYQKFPSDRLKIRTWIGISTNEMRRVRVAKEIWQEFVYPLLGLPDKMMELSYSRKDCEKWLQKNYPDHKVSRSACIICPFHDNYFWDDLQKNSPEEFKKAVEFDKLLRSHTLPFKGDVFLHKSLKPLDKIKFLPKRRETLEETIRQIQGEFVEECEGMCGL